MHTVWPREPKEREKKSKWVGIVSCSFQQANGDDKGVHTELWLTYTSSNKCVLTSHLSAHSHTKPKKKWREMIVKNRRTPRAALETTHHHINDFTSFPFFSLTKTLTMVYKEQQWVGSPPGAYVDTDMRDERGKHKEEHDVRQKRILKHERYHLRKNSRCVNKFGGGTLKSKTRRGEWRDGKVKKEREVSKPNKVVFCTFHLPMHACTAQLWLTSKNEKGISI